MGKKGLKGAVKLLLLMLLVLMCSTAWAQDELVVPLDHWSYPVLDRFLVLGRIAPLPTARPWTRGEVKRALKPLFQAFKEEPTGFSRSDRYLITKLREEFGQPVWDKTHRTAADKTALGFGEDGKHIGLDIALNETGSVPSKGSRSGESDGIFEALGAYKNAFAFDEQLTFAHTGTSAPEGTFLVLPKGYARTWKGGWYFPDRAYFRGKLPWIEVEAGRDNLWWGPGRHGTLLLSDNMPLDMISLSASLGIARMDYFHATLSAYQGRYLAGHRLSLRLPGTTQVGFSENVLYISQNPEPTYLNPLMPYYASQQLLGGVADSMSNILWSFELQTNPLKGLKLYGELLVDDYQYEQTPPAPNKLGFLGGFQVSNPLGLQNIDLQAEYTRINRWVYTHKDSTVAYVYDFHPLGDWLGSDADDFWAALTVRPLPRWTVEGSYELERHGQGRDLFFGWHEGDDPATVTLSGVVETTQRPALKVSYEPAWWLNLSVLDQYSTVKNLGNVTNQSSSQNMVNGELRLNF